MITKALSRPRFRFHLPALSRRWRIAMIALAVVIVLLIALRLALPSLVKRYVNRTLDRLPGYAGQVGDIDIHLWRGAYSIDTLKIVKTGGKVPVPFFSTRRADLSIEWASIFDGALVGEIELYQPKLNFVNGKGEADSQTSVDKRWQDVVADLFPLRFNRFAIHGGEVHYRDLNSDPKVDVSIDSIEAEATNLTNSKKISKTLVASLKGKGRAEGHAPVTLNLEMDPYQKHPTFNLDAEVKELNLVKLNDFFKAYANFDVESGKFSLYTELAAANKNFKGYLKPLLHDVHAFRIKSDSSNPLRVLWEGVVAVVLEAIQNQRHDQLATKIPLRGSFEKPDIDLWRAVGTILSNAFIEALVPGVEKSINLKDVD